LIAWGAPFFCRRRLFCTACIEAPAEPGARPCFPRLILDYPIKSGNDEEGRPEDDQRNAWRVTGGAYIKTTLPARLQARTAGRMGALFAGAAQKGKNPGIYKLISHLVHSRVFEFFLE